MACRQELSRCLPQGIGTQSAVQLSHSRLIEAVKYGSAAAGNHRTMHHAEVLKLAQLGAQGIHAQPGAFHDFSAAARSMPERMDDRQSDGIAEHYGGLSDKFRLAFGARYGGHGVHLV